MVLSFEMSPVLPGFAALAVLAPTFTSGMTIDSFRVARSHRRRGAAAMAAGETGLELTSPC